jgi:hypothetical protein
MSNYKGELKLAVQEHLLSGEPLTRLEGLVLFGLASITAEISTMRTSGWIIQSRRVPYRAVLRRINKYAVLQPPEQLPINDIVMTEYWVSQ